jgi:hypothetical protein
MTLSISRTFQIAVDRTHFDSFARAETPPTEVSLGGLEFGRDQN